MVKEDLVGWLDVTVDTKMVVVLLIVMMKSVLIMWNTRCGMVGHRSTVSVDCIVVLLCVIRRVEWIG